MRTGTRGFIYWTPRILSIVFIAFLTLMSLDVISPELSWEQIVIGLFMHNIPALVMLVVLVVSWKHEIVGGIAFLLAGMLYIAVVIRAALPWNIAFSWGLTIAGPAFLIATCFFMGWRNKRTHH